MNARFCMLIPFVLPYGAFADAPPGIPSSPIVLYGTVADATNNKTVAISSVGWQVSDGAESATISATSAPPTRIVNQSGESFYVLEVPFETRAIKDSAGQTLRLARNGQSLELKSPSPTYTLTATVNGLPTTIQSVDGVSVPANTTAYTFDDYTPVTQGRMVRVDLYINETAADPYASWVAVHFADPDSPNAARTADPDHDGQTNEEEFAAGTDPLDAQSAFLLTSVSRPSDLGETTLTWSSVPGRTYQVESSATLNSETWQSVGNPILASTATQSTNIEDPPDKNHIFYRIRVLPQP
ncbi:MAG: hypothetical protein R3F19_17745 [Verrucomicrobiales bacterium]